MSDHFFKTKQGNIQIHAPVELAKSDQRKVLATECLAMRTSGPLSDSRPLHMGMS